MRNILICGSTGPITYLLQKTLLSLNSNIYVIGRNYFNNNNFVESNINNIYFNDIYFLISSLKVSLNSEIINLNSLPELSMLSLIFKHLKFNRIIFFSSAGSVYGSSNELLTESSPRLPVSNYGKSKILIEDFILKSSTVSEFKYLILRISNPFGIYSSKLFNYGLIPAIFNSCFNKSNLIVNTNISFRKDYIGVDLLYLIFTRIFHLQDISGVYNIGSGESFSISSLITMIQLKTGKHSNHVEIDGIQSIDSDVGFLDVSKSFNDFNINLFINFESNIDLMVDYYRSNFHVA